MENEFDKLFGDMDKLVKSKEQKEKDAIAKAAEEKIFNEEAAKKFFAVSVPEAIKTLTTALTNNGYSIVDKRVGSEGFKRLSYDISIANNITFDLTFSHLAGATANVEMSSPRVGSFSKQEFEIPMDATTNLVKKISEHMRKALARTQTLPD